MLRPGYFFTQTNTGPVTGNNYGTDLLKPVYTESVTSITRSPAIFCSSFTTIAIDIVGTATVQIIHNPFDGVPIAKDRLMTTLTASGTYVTPGAGAYLISVTAVTGTVSARASFDQDMVC